MKKEAIPAACILAAVVIIAGLLIVKGLPPKPPEPTLYLITAEARLADGSNAKFNIMVKAFPPRGDKDLALICENIKAHVSARGTILASSPVILNIEEIK